LKRGSLRISEPRTAAVDSLSGSHLAVFLEGDTVVIQGWAVGRDCAVTEVEVRLGNAVVARTPVNRPRPDVAERFPMASGSKPGFRIALAASALETGELDIRIRVDGSVVSLASVDVETPSTRSRMRAVARRWLLRD
jgi:hypothetical protein